MTAPLVLLVAGSGRTPSRTTTGLQVAAGLLTRAGLRPVLWDLAARPLPFVDPAQHRTGVPHSDPVVRQLGLVAEAAAGFVLATPCYHGSFSGVLKNCLDHLAIEHFRHKPVGLVAHGSSLTAVQACEQLRCVVRSLYGLALPEQLVTTPADFAADPDPRLSSAAALTRMAQLCDALADQVRLRHERPHTSGPGRQRPPAVALRTEPAQPLTMAIQGGR